MHLAPELARRGFEVRALGVTGRKIDGVLLTNYKIQDKKSSDVHPFAIEFETKIIRAESCARAMLKLKTEGFEPAVIVGHPGWGETLFCKEIFPNAKLINYLEFHYGKDKGDTYFDAELQHPDLLLDMRLRVRNAINLIALDSMDVGLCPTQWQLSSIPSYFKDRVQVVFDGIDTEAVSPDPNASITLKTHTGIELNLRAGDEVLTFVCRNLEPYRGYHSLMRSLPHILRERPSARVLIVGGNETSYGAPPPSGQTWKEVFLNDVKDELDLTRIHFLGRVPYAGFLKVIQISRCHLYLTYPFVLSWSCLEAMSAGAVVVGSKTPPVEEFIQHDYNGLLVDFFDYRAIAQTVIDVLSQPEKFKHIRDQARQSIIDQYDLRTHCLPKQVSIVEQLARSS